MALGIGAGIAAGAKAVWLFVKAHAGAVATTASAAAIALAGNSFEGKRKSVTFDKSDIIPVGKYAFRVPQLKVKNVRNSEGGSSRTKKTHNSYYSRKQSG